MLNQDRPYAVLFDMGGTLEDVRADHESYVRGAQVIGRLLQEAGVAGQALDPAQLAAAIEEGLNRYKKEMCVGQVCYEQPPLEIWSKWLLHGPPFLPARLTAALAEELSFTWETRCLERSLRPDAKPVLQELIRRGYPLGVVSNSIALAQVDYTLRRHGLTPYFATVQVSTLAGRRKPDPLMFRRAAADLGVPPQRCLHVGDSYTRDVAGARAARLGYVLWLGSPPGELTGAAEVPDPSDGEGTEPATWMKRITSLSEIPRVLDEKPWRSTSMGGLG